MTEKKKNPETQKFYQDMWAEINEAIMYKEPAEMEVAFIKPIGGSEAPNDMPKLEADAVLRPSANMSDEEDEWLASLLGEK